MALLGISFRKHPRTTLLLLAAGLLAGCSLSPSGTFYPSPGPEPRADPIAELLPESQTDQGQAQTLEKLGYSIQVGAFENLDNAVRLERRLEARGIEAYYFRHESGLYKVRFGNHASYQAARGEAESLQLQGLIGNFFIVAPEDYAVARIHAGGGGDLRAELVGTARSFLGVPYRWGGTDSEDGFDCSGLTMVCYRLNGLNLPRISRNQFQAGRRVSRSELRPGDLVFFATNGGRQVSHVGIYIGHGRFIHAPRTGQTVRVEELSNPFFLRTYLGGRCYF